MQKKMLSYIVIVILMMTISNVYSQIGKVGINTTSPEAMLHVKDSSVVFTGTSTLPPIPGNPPVSGAGRRLMWYPAKSSFRVGTVNGSGATFWNKDSIGNYSIAMGYNTKAKGLYSISFGNSNSAIGLSSAAFGSGTTASGTSSTATGQGTIASGNHSTAMGLETIASGIYATSMGALCIANGSYSTAMGSGTSSGGTHSTAMGINTEASGIASTSMGAFTWAKSYNSTVVGRWNDVTSMSSLEWVDNDPLFIIGNGNGFDERSNAFTVLKNAKTGINTAFPLAMLHVQDSSVLFAGPPSLPSFPTNPPVSGSGIRMMWYPVKAAFRAGRVTDTEWNKDSIGNYSIAMGENPKAKGWGSISLGTNTEARGPGSTSIGYASKAIGDYSTALGKSTVASGYGSFASGDGTLASGFIATAMGYASIASGAESFALGYECLASGQYATATGVSTKAIGSASFSIGTGSVARGHYSFAASLGTIARSYASFVIGRYNDSTSISSDSWNVIDPLFIIGNGTANNARSNAFTILKNGKVGIGVHNPGFLLNFPNGFGDKISLWGSSGNHYGIGVQSGLLQIHTDASVADVVFGYGTSAAFNETMRIEGTGNVGIGTTTPDYKLDVEGRARIASGGSAGTSAGIYYNKVDNSATASFIGMFSDDYVGFFGDLGAGWDFVMHTGTGNVGIGSLSPSQRLHVVGNGLFTGTVTASCGVLVCSDERYKTNIQPLTSALSSILLLQGIQYDWKSEQFPEKNFPHTSQIGFSAQELEKIYPEVVHTDEGGYKTVDYTRLTPVLVEAMKEQQLQINTLTSELNQLKEIVITMLKSGNQ